MNTPKHIAVAATAAAMFLGANAFAQSPAAVDVQHDQQQQQNIEQGLKSGQLSTQEAAHLEHQEAQVDKMQQRDLSKGPMTQAEQAQLASQQKKVTENIHAEKNNSTVGARNSPSSQAMQADVQRNVNQQQRIEQGINSGHMTNSEVAHAERGQQGVTRAESAAGANGHVNSAEQAQIQQRQATQSQHIYNMKHNRQNNPPPN